MVTLTTRAVKGAPLTWAEVDANWNNINGAGSAGQVLFNNAGQLAGASGLTYDQATGRVTVAAPSSGTAFTVNCAASSTAVLYTGQNPKVSLADNQSNGAIINYVCQNTLNYIDFTWTSGSVPAAIRVGGGNAIAFSTIAAVQIPSTPLTAATTQAATGLAAFRSTDATAVNNTLTADTSLTLTFNETGHYALKVFLAFYEATVSTGGFQFDLGSGTATVAGLLLAVDGFVTAAVANAVVTSTTTATTAATVASSSTAPSWFMAEGWVNISVAGTLAVRWAQNSTLGADPTTLKTGSHILAIKIG